MVGAFNPNGEISPSYRRRIYPRERVSVRRIAFDLDLGPGTACRVLNISEGGLAIQAVENCIEYRLTRIRFKFFRSHVWVETGGRVVWANELRDVAGVEFTN